MRFYCVGRKKNLVLVSSNGAVKQCADQPDCYQECHNLCLLFFIVSTYVVVLTFEDALNLLVGKPPWGILRP